MKHINKFNERYSGKETGCEYKNDFIKALETLFYSWGSEAPPEAYWAANELLDWFEKEFDSKIDDRFDENGENVEEIFDKIRNTYPGYSL
jgi:hypothetical protein